MHNRLHKFLNNNNIFYPLQFGFQHNTLYTSFALIHLTESIKEALDQGKYGCGIFVDLKKAFDSVDNKSLMTKSKHYNVKGVAYSWFE